MTNNDGFSKISSSILFFSGIHKPPHKLLEEFQKKLEQIATEQL